MNNYRCQQSDAGDPDTAAMQRGLEQVAVFIDGVSADKDQQVADHVAKHKADQDEAGQGHQNLLANGGGVKSRKGVKNSAHVGRNSSWRYDAAVQAVRAIFLMKQCCDSVSIQHKRDA